MDVKDSFFLPFYFHANHMAMVEFSQWTPTACAFHAYSKLCARKWNRKQTSWNVHVLSKNKYAQFSGRFAGNYLPFVSSETCFL